VCAALFGATALAVVSGPAGAAGKPAGNVYVNYHGPLNLIGNAPEPTMGVDFESGRALYIANLKTARATWDDRKNPPAVKWEDKSFVMTSVATLDPILELDTKTGRAFVSQLAGACSLMASTDDVGDTWMPSEGCGPLALFDHQTVGGGPYAKSGVGLLPKPLYPHAVYYCSQAVADASCARSDDGGLTFGPGVPIYNITQCSGLHGHMTVGPDGAAYIPNFDCNGEQGLVVSEDNGLTWTPRTVPDSLVNAESDPVAAVGAKGTTYFAWQDGDFFGNTTAKVAVTRDHGRTYTRIADLGRKLGIKNVQFPHIVAGDDDRAAVAFLGSTTGGDDQSADFEGSWRLYIAHTYDAGKTWTTYNATPKELVQRGCIQLSRSCKRNLLDFNDMSIDRTGRVYVAWADGCDQACERDADDNRWQKQGVITRQIGGKGVFRVYDGLLKARGVPNGTTVRSADVTLKPIGPALVRDDVVLAGR
jgi:hypothetical protein